MMKENQFLIEGVTLIYPNLRKKGSYQGKEDKYYDTNIVLDSKTHEKQIFIIRETIEKLSKEIYKEEFKKDIVDKRRLAYKKEGIDLSEEETAEKIRMKAKSTIVKEFPNIDFAANNFCLKVKTLKKPELYDENLQLLDEEIDVGTGSMANVVINITPTIYGAGFFITGYLNKEIQITKVVKKGGVGISMFKKVDNLADEIPF